MSTETEIGMQDDRWTKADGGEILLTGLCLIVGPPILTGLLAPVAALGSLAELVFGIAAIFIPLLMVIGAWMLFLGGLTVCFASRHRPGHCHCCDYNLTGNVSGVCPECGTAVEKTEPKP
jgi:hypothetical protein